MQSIAEKYGVQESNGLVDGATYHAGVDYSDEITLAELQRRGGKISRVRILTGNWGGQKMADVSYIHATLPSGQVVPVNVTGDVMGVPLWGPRGMKARFIEWAKEEGVFAKGIGLLDEANWSILH